MAAFMLAGCGGVSDEPTPEPEAAVVVVGVIDKESQEFLDVPASVCVGGVRGTATVEEGSVVLRDIPFGTGSPPNQPLSVHARGYVSTTRHIQLSVTQATFETAELEATDLEKTGIVQGTVTSESGDPITSALVSFEYEQIGGDVVVVDAFTDNEGYYIVGGIPIGRVNVSISASNYLSEEAVVNVVQAAGQEQPQQMDFELVSGETKVTLRGQVVDVMTSAPIVGAEVTVGDRPPVNTDENGGFVVREVFVGQQELTVTADGYDDYRQILQVTPTIGQLRVQMNPAAPDPPIGPWTIRGTVTLVGAPDNAGANVEVFDTQAAAIVAEDTTDAEGLYHAFVPPGEYRITVSFEDRSISRTVTLPGGGSKLSGIDFTLTIE